MKNNHICLWYDEKTGRCWEVHCDDDSLCPYKSTKNSCECPYYNEPYVQSNCFSSTQTKGSCKTQV